VRKEVVSLECAKKGQNRNETYSVNSNVSTSSLIRFIACLDIVPNDQNCVSTTGAQDGGSEVEGVAIGVVGT